MISKCPAVDNGEWTGFERRQIPVKGCELSIRIGGRPDGEVVLLSHSILTNSAIWATQAQLLVSLGFRVICVDTRGHGQSAASAPPYSMDNLVADVVAVLDDLRVSQVHFVGESQGGMVGLGLGVIHPQRLLSLLVVAARADAPPLFAAAWDERVAIVERNDSVAELAEPTAERWFGKDFLHANPSVADALSQCINKTSAKGFIGCARAIQGLNYLSRVPTISARTTLVIGELDELLLQPMRDLVPTIPNAVLHEIAGAGHLPQIDQAERFQEILLLHFQDA
ncbi:alpha/beta fold hydrolase [Trinickia sp. EG282A]|uniref:alpha/beta fold hydrolase n=1 Tax=Trinickia sp. EG282A TaxID=3237013 RepID=UPI0034D1CD44